MSTATETALLERPVLEQLPVEHLVDFNVDLEPGQIIPTALGIRMTYIVKHGVFEGPKLRGEVLPGGGDWILADQDRIALMDIRATLRTSDDALIHYTALGVTMIPGDGLERLAAGERLPFEETYVRTTPRFETADERYSWLNRIVAVSHSELSPHVDHRIYRVL